MSKYELTDETRQVAGHTLHRIRAVRTFGDVRKGALGGWIESKDNLSQKRNCWVYDGACVYGHAKVYGDAQVCDSAKVHGYAHVCDDALVCDHADVYGCARVFGNADVCDRAKVCGDAWVYNDAEVHDCAKVRGDARVLGHTIIRGDAYIGSYADYTVLRNSWSSGRWITYTRSNRKWNVGCFYGTGKQLIVKAYKDNERKGKCYEAIVRAAEQIEAAMAEERKEKP